MSVHFTVSVCGDNWGDAKRAYEWLLRTAMMGYLAKHLFMYRIISALTTSCYGNVTQKLHKQKHFFAILLLYRSD